MPSIRFLVDHLGDALEQHALVHLIRQLVDDDRRTRALVDLFEMRLGAHHHAAAPGAIAFAYAFDAVDDSRGRKIRRRNQLDQFIDARLRIAQQRQTTVDHFAEIVRRNIGRHSHRDAGRAIDQQVWHARGQHQRLLLLAVVIRSEVDRFLVDIDEQRRRDLRQPALGVAHRRGVIAIDRAEIALPVDQQIAQRKRLRHSDERVVNRLVAVRVIFTHHIADDARALHIRPAVCT